VANALILQFSLQLRRGLSAERTQPGERGTGRPSSVLMHGRKRNPCQPGVHDRREWIRSATCPLANEPSNSCGNPDPWSTWPYVIRQKTASTMWFNRIWETWVQV